MGNVTNLGQATDEFKGITIYHEMTIKEREQCKEFVDEARKDLQKQNEKTGNFVYVVRGLPGQRRL